MVPFKGWHAHIGTRFHKTHIGVATRHAGAKMPCGLGPQHVRNGRIRYRQAKNEHSNPVDIDIPLHPDLPAAIAAAPSEHLTFLVTDVGRPSAHGLRKATSACDTQDRSHLLSPDRRPRRVVGIRRRATQRHRSTIPASKHKDAKGRPYEPAVIAHMDSTPLPEGETLPPIEIWSGFA
jgi:hypothetical protein